ncbi:hypothetical protein D3C78_1929670 [compost metagenome]
MLAIVAHQLGWHAFQLAAVEHVEEQRLQNIVAVVAKGNFGGPQLGSGAVKNAAAQA